MWPLYAKLQSDNYHPLLSLKEATAHTMADCGPFHMKHRKATTKHPQTERIVYTDDAGRSKIAAAVCLAPATCAPSEAIDYEMDLRTGNNWRTAFGKPDTSAD